MKKCLRKSIAIVLALIMVLSTGIMTYAAPINEETNSSIYELEQFLTKDDNGLIVFDAETALSEGFANDIVTLVEQQITAMNNWVIQGIAYIDENYSAVILLPSTRAQGESKVVVHWYGLTEIYMNSDEAQELIDSLNAVGGIADDADVIGDVLGGWAAFITGTFSAGIALSVWQVEQAAAPGTGIIMCIMNIQGVYGMTVQSIWFLPQ